MSWVDDSNIKALQALGKTTAETFYGRCSDARLDGLTDPIVAAFSLTQALCSIEHVDSAK